MRLTVKTDSLLKKTLITTLFLACTTLFVFSATTFLGNAVAIGASDPAASEFAASLAPGEPFAYYGTAVMLEGSMRSGDLPRSLEMYEQAAALEPHDYLFWLELAKAKERNGDAESAEKALRYAETLAPYYPTVQWSLGNVLIRRGKDSEGFVHLRKAVEGDGRFAGPSASMAWALFEGDMNRVTEVIGNSGPVKAALANLLAGQKKFDEAIRIWNTLPVGEKKERYADSGSRLIKELLAAKKFAAAATIQNQIAEGGPRVGVISNGGFEEDVTLDRPSAFEWNIGKGSNPKIGLSVERKHSGGRSLAMIFGEGGKKGFRTVTQAVPVESGQRYRFRAFYKARLETERTVIWEILDATSGDVLASGEPLPAESDWQETTIDFAVPEGSEGIVIRFVREKCQGGECSISGDIWLDDVSLSTL